MIVQGGTAGVIGRSQATSAGALVFNTTGYSLNRNSITLNGLGGTAGVISLGSGIAAVSVGSILNGANGLIFNGNGLGVLTTSAANTMVGPIKLSSGGITPARVPPITPSTIPVQRSPRCAVSTYGTDANTGTQAGGTTLSAPNTGVNIYAQTAAALTAQATATVSTLSLSGQATSRSPPARGR